MKSKRFERVCTECGAVVVGPEGHKCDACGCGLLTSLTLAYCTLRQKRQSLQQENEVLWADNAALRKENARTNVEHTGLLGAYDDLEQAAAKKEGEMSLENGRLQTRIANQAAELLHLRKQIDSG